MHTYKPFGSCDWVIDWEVAQESDTSGEKTKMYVLNGVNWCCGKMKKKWLFKNVKSGIKWCCECKLCALRNEDVTWGLWTVKSF